MRASLQRDASSADGGRRSAGVRDIDIDDGAADAHERLGTLLAAQASNARRVLTVPHSRGHAHESRGRLWNFYGVHCPDVGGLLLRVLPSALRNQRLQGRRAYLPELRVRGWPQQRSVLGTAEAQFFVWLYDFYTGGLACLRRKKKEEGRTVINSTSIF